MRVKKRDQEGSEDEAFEEFHGCEICKETGDESTLLLCDGMHGTCNAAYHTACVGLSCVPRGSWFCPDCTLRGFDVDARGVRGKRPSMDPEPAPSSRVAETASLSSRPSSLPAGSPGVSAPAQRTAEANLEAGDAPAPAASAPSQSSSGRRAASSAVPPQYRLNTLACVTPAVEVPSFHSGGAANASSASGGNSSTPEPEGLFASFAARRRARRNAGSAGSSTSATSFIQLNPAYEEDFMGKALK